MPTLSTVLALVFPAHAGMSLLRRQLASAPGSFPRSRGDEPSWKVRTVTGLEFSPLTRG